MRLLFVAVMSWCAWMPAVQAQEASLLSVPGFADMIAAYAKQTKALGYMDADLKTAIGGYLPVRTLKDSAGIKYASIGFGGTISMGEHFRPRFVALLDASSTWRRIEAKSAWYESHVEKLRLPDFWLGPQFFPALDSSFRWDKYKGYLGVAVAIGL